MFGRTLTSIDFKRNGGEGGGDEPEGDFLLFEDGDIVQFEDDDLVLLESDGD